MQINVELKVRLNDFDRSDQITETFRDYCSHKCKFRRHVSILAISSKNLYVWLYFVLLPSLQTEIWYVWQRNLPSQQHQVHSAGLTGPPARRLSFVYVAFFLSLF